MLVSADHAKQIRTTDLRIAGAETWDSKKAVLNTSISAEKLSRNFAICEIGREDQRTKYLITGAFWWSRGGSNSWPPHCESDSRQKRKLLPFRKLQPPRDFKGFPVFSHSLPSHIRRVQLFLSTYWPLGNGVHLGPRVRPSSQLGFRVSSQSTTLALSSADSFGNEAGIGSFSP